MQFELADYVIIIVEDLDRSLGFYRDVLGLTLGHRAGDYAQFNTGATRLSLYTRRAMVDTLGVEIEPAPKSAPGFELGFKVDDVDAAYADLVNHGATPMTPPTSRAWGQRTAYLRDPDGHLIELAQAIEIIAD